MFFMRQTVTVLAMTLSVAAAGAFAADDRSAAVNAATVEVDCTALSAQQIGQMTRVDDRVQLEAIAGLIEACPANVDAIIAAAIEASPDDAELIVAYVTEQLPTAAGRPTADSGNLFTPGNSTGPDTSNSVPSPGSGGGGRVGGSSGPAASAS